MSGLLRRLKRRPATAEENRSPAAESSDPVAASAETPAESGGQSPAPAAAGEQPTVVLPATTDQPLPAWTVAATQPTAFAAQPAPPRDLPAGVDPGDLAAAPAASARRGKLRRRLRYLRHVRELLLRDLGGFTYEIHRSAGGTAQEPQRRLTTAKAERIAKLDEEVLALEARLGEPHAEVVLREPGIGGTCRECGELHASDARFCSRCGAPLDEQARTQQPAPEPPVIDTQTTAEPQPASVLWAGGPRPAPEPAEEAEPEVQPSEVTSQWLAPDRPTTFWARAQPEEPAKAPEPALDEPATAVGVPEPAEPVAADEGTTAADEPVTAADEPVEATEEPAPAKPKRASKPRKRAPAKPRAKRAPKSFEANGRRDDDVPPPPIGGDPVASPREQGS